MYTKYQAVIWDYDGVLADSHLFNQNSCIEAAKACGILLTPKDYSKHFYPGVSLLQGAKSLLNLHKLEHKLDIFIEKKKSYDPEYINSVISYQDIEDTINKLHELGMKQAICSGSRRFLIEEYLKKYQLSKCINLIVSSEDTTLSKPDPEGYILTSNKLQIDPKFCLVIEDGISGIKAAKSAKIDVVAITNTESKESLVREKPTLVISNPKSIVEFITRK